MKRITHLLLAIRKRFVRKIVGNCICHIINLNLCNVIWFSSCYFLFITRDRLIGVFRISQIIEFPIGRKCVQSEIKVFIFPINVAIWKKPNQHNANIGSVIYSLIPDNSVHSVVVRIEIDSRIHSPFQKNDLTYSILSADIDHLNIYRSYPGQSSHNLKHLLSDDFSTWAKCQFWQ